MTETNFNIEEYINSLPNDVEDIYLCNKNLTYIPDLSRFVNLKYLDCDNNQLTYLPNLPSSLVGLYCSYNQLINLQKLPNNLEVLDCNSNKLTYLPSLPNSLNSLFCYNNKLTYLPELPNCLKVLDCNSNKLTYLPSLHNSLNSLFCYNNQLTNLPNLPNSLTKCSIHFTNISEIINIDYITKNEIIETNNKLSIFNKFRKLYFALKFKKQFYKLYETVAMKRYHPSNLIKLLENVGNDEEKMDLLLESW
jgi:hypothetical protein